MWSAGVGLALVLALTALPLRAVPAAAATLNSRIDELAGTFPGGAAIWVADPSLPQPLYARNPDEQVITASLYKLALLAEAEHQVELGRLHYSDTIVIDAEDITEDGSFVAPGAELTLDDALEQMITISDNGTAMHLWRMLGPATINAYLEKSGIKASASRSTSRRTTSRPRARSGRTSRSSRSGSSSRPRRPTACCDGSSASRSTTASRRSSRRARASRTRPGISPARSTTPASSSP